jgi:hypothetical protein
MEVSMELAKYISGMQVTGAWLHVPLYVQRLIRAIALAWCHVDPFVPRLENDFIGSGLDLVFHKFKVTAIYIILLYSSSLNGLLLL